MAGERTAYQRNWKRSHPESQMLTAARQRAKRAGVPCTITQADIRAAWADKCPVFGFDLTRGAKGTRAHDRSSYTLDRIDPAKGYVPGNIQILSSRANTMKSDATPEELLQFAAWINATYGGAPHGG